MRVLLWLSSLSCALVALAAAGFLWLPAERLPVDVSGEPQVVPIAPSALRPNGGLAYYVPIDTAIPSDNPNDHPDDLPEGERYRSPLVVLEDGEPLPAPHSGHRAIRENGEGRYSHWGRGLYLSASDGSDPRSNGRRYAYIDLPSRESLAPDVRLAAQVLLIAAAAAFVLSLFLRGERGVAGRVLWRGLCLGLVALSTLPTQGLRTWWSLAESLDDATRLQALRGLAIERTGASALPAPAAAPAEVGPRTLRLADDLAAVPFTLQGEAPAARQVREVPLDGEGSGQHVSGVLKATQQAPLVSAEGLGLTADQMARLVLRMRVQSGSELKLTFETTRADGTPGDPRWVLFPIRPGEDWTAIEIHRPLERGVLMSGDLRAGRSTISRIVLRPGPGSGPLALELAPLQLSDPMAVYSAATHGHESRELQRSTRPALWQSAPGRFALPWTSAAGDLLKGAVGLLSDDESARARFRVLLEDGAGGVTELLTGTARADTGWSEQRVALAGGLAGGDARLVLEATELPAGSVLFWSGWRTLDTSRPARRVLLVLIDTLRADALACYGHPDNATPTLDGLAAEGCRFANAISQAHWTRPSMPSIMTGHYVAATSVTTGSEHLHGAYTTLAECFAAAGFHTLGVLANSHAGRSNGLDQGLDELVLDSHLETTAEFLDQRAESRLAQLEEEDLFAWVHLMEVHGPYGPREQPDDHQPPPEDAELLPWTERFDRPWHERPTRAARVHYYNTDLENLDRGLGAFLEQRLSVWEGDGTRDTVIAVASDHGELLGDYDQWGHMWPRMVPETVHVPLIVRAPQRLPEGVVHTPAVENIDLGATLLDLAGVDVSGRAGAYRVGGRSLVPFVTGEADAADGALALAAVDPGHSGWGTLSVFSADGGLVGDAGGLVGTLFEQGAELAPLPEGSRMTDITHGVGPGFRELWAAHLATQAQVRRALLADADEESSMTTLDAESLEQMRALGYIGREADHHNERR